MTNCDPYAQEREIGEWDWWVTVDQRWNSRLHAATAIEIDPAYDTTGDATTACGRSMRVCIPGVFSRMGLWRCERCCTALGYPQGCGSPKNDKACRPLVEARLSEQTARVAS